MKPDARAIGELLQALLQAETAQLRCKAPGCYKVTRYAVKSVYTNRNAIPPRRCAHCGYHFKATPVVVARRKVYELD